MSLHLGVAHHFGWAVIVTATDGHDVVDRRRVDLIAEGVPAAPVHHRGGLHEMHSSPEQLDDRALESLVAEVRASACEMTAVALEGLVDDVGDRIDSISLREWPADFPTDIARLRAAPYESQADSVMYRQVFAELAADRGWTVRRFDAAGVEAEASEILGDRAHEVLYGPRVALGAPWNKDHRIALAATVVAATTSATQGRRRAPHRRGPR